MHWKLKAKVQNAISHLPDAASYSLYYWVQRNFGGLKNINPSKRLMAGIETWKRIQKHSVSPSGKVFFEVGTGRVPTVPLAYWLMGAEKTITVDANPYLREELVAESLNYIIENEAHVRGLFGELLNEDRFSAILRLARSPSLSIEEFNDLCRIVYIAPGDAGDTPLNDNSIDFHTSYTVFEHIPKEELLNIINEGNRITNANGLFIHRIDYSDHFSHSDKSISAINFLKYSDAEWLKYAGNKYMYMNRLRHDDFIDLFESVAHIIMSHSPDRQPNLLDNIRNGDIELSAEFSQKSEDIIATTGAWFVTRKGKESECGSSNESTASR